MATYSGYSAALTGHLHVAGQVFPLERVGPNVVGVRTTSAIPLGEAEIVVTVDGKEDRSRVLLTEALDKPVPQFRYQRLS